MTERISEAKLAEIEQAAAPWVSRTLVDLLLAEIRELRKAVDERRDRKPMYHAECGGKCHRHPENGTWVCETHGECCHDEMLTVETYIDGLRKQVDIGKGIIEGNLQLMDEMRAKIESLIKERDKLRDELAEETWKRR